MAIAPVSGLEDVIDNSDPRQPPIGAGFGRTVSLMERMDLLALANFNLVARRSGFGKAARAAGRAKATLSRRVAELEASLDLRLFERGARSLKLTPEGRVLFERTGALLTELDETAKAIASGGRSPRGRLRISAPLLFLQTAMVKLAAGFMRKYPEVRLEITTEDRAVDMIEEAYDLVIRVNPNPDAGLVGRIFLRDRLLNARVSAFLDHLKAATPQGNADELAAYVEG